MADAGTSGKICNLFLLKHILDKADALMQAYHALVVKGGDATALLPAMLQGLERQECVRGRVFYCEEPNHTALLVQLSVVYVIH